MVDGHSVCMLPYVVDHVLKNTHGFVPDKLVVALSIYQHVELAPAGQVLTSENAGALIFRYRFHSCRTVGMVAYSKQTTCRRTSPSDATTFLPKIARTYEVM